jgi:hypothetical protein
LILTKRKVAWFGEKAFEYTYSKRTKYAKFWTPELLELKKNVKKFQEKPIIPVCLIYIMTEAKEWLITVMPKQI